MAASKKQAHEERDPFVIDSDDDEAGRGDDTRKRSSADDASAHQHRQELLHSAQDGDLPSSLRPPSLRGHTGSKVTGNALLYGVSVFSSLGVFLFGWDQG